MTQITSDKRHARSIMATTALARGRFATLGGAYALPHDDVAGVTEGASAAGRLVSLVTGFSAPVEAAGAVGIGDRVGPANDGSGRAVVGGLTGMALTAAGAAGEFIEVQLFQAGALRPAHVRAVQALIDDRLGRTVGYDNEQPADITRAVLRPGKLVCEFLNGQWAASISAPALTQGYTGWNGAGVKTGVTSRTGRKGMLRAVANAAATQGIDIQVPATNLLNKALAGLVGVWVYLEGYTGGSLTMEVSTSGSFSNDLLVSWNGNALKEGWNFVVGRMRNPLAYIAGNNVTEYNPVGVAITSQGTGANSNIVANNIASLRFYWNSAMNGTTLYFDSVWTDFQFMPQLVLSNDAGVGLMEYAVPVMDSYGWLATMFFPFQVGGTPTDLNANVSATGKALYARGWDFGNHTMTHPSVGAFASEADIEFELANARAWQQGLAMPRGQEFYAAPNGSTSLLAQRVIRQMGIKAQRTGHGKWCGFVTPWGVDSLDNVGSYDMASPTAACLNSVTNNVTTSILGGRRFSILSAMLDTAIDYMASAHLFWHGITVTGDDGTGESVTGDSLLLVRSAAEMFFAHARQKELANTLAVPKGYTGWYYGSNA